MRKFSLSLFLLFLSLSVFAANVTFEVYVQGLTAASAVSGADLLPCIQATLPRKCTATQIKTFVGTSGGTTGAMVHNANNISFANNSFSAPLWDTLDYDTGSYWAGGVNGYFFTVPATGRYLLVGTMAWVANGTGNRIMGFFKNHSAAIAYGQANQTPNATNATEVTSSVILSLTAGDTVEMAIFQTSGGALNFIGTNTSMFEITSLP